MDLTLLLPSRLTMWRIMRAMMTMCLRTVEGRRKTYLTCRFDINLHHFLSNAFLG